MTSSAPPRSRDGADVEDVNTAIDRRSVVTASVVAAIAFAVACFVVDRLARAGFYGPLGDALWVQPFATPADAILRGAFPYRDVPIEYPPGGLPVFLLPAVLARGGGYGWYRGFFEVLMTLCGMAIVPLVAATVAAVGARRAALVAAVAAVAVSPLLIGPLVLSRFDLWPALLTAAATACAVTRRRRLAFALLGAAIVTKVYPVVLVPIFAIEAWRARGRREAVLGLVIAGAVSVAAMAPFVLAAPAAALDPLTRSFARPLQVESLGAAILVLAHDLAGLRLDPIRFDFGSHNLVGALPAAVASLQSLAMVVAVVLVWVAAARGELSPRRLVVASAAALTLEVALGKVFSTQYVIWLVPAIAVLVPIRGVKPVLVLGAVLVLAAFFYPGRYREFIQTLDLTSALAIAVKDLLVLGLGAYLVVALRRTGRLAPP